MFREDGSLYMRGRVLDRESLWRQTFFHDALGEESSPLSWQSNKLKTLGRKQTSIEKDRWVIRSCLDHVFWILTIRLLTLGQPWLRHNMAQCSPRFSPGLFGLNLCQISSTGAYSTSSSKTTLVEWKALVPSKSKTVKSHVAESQFSKLSMF